MVSGQAGRMAIRNTSNVTLALFPYTTSVSGGATAQQLPINYQLQPGNYNFFFETMPASGLRMNTSNAVYPYTSYVAAITGNGTDFGSNLGCYNWKFTTECISPRIAVPVTVTTPPSLTLSASAISICDGTASSLVTVNGYQAYNTLTWSPNTGVSGSFAGGFTFNPTTTTTYYLTASQNGGNLCGNRASITITVLPSPPQVAIIPESTSMCFNAVQALNGSTSSSSPATAYSENFNSPTNNWVVQNTSFGGDLLASQWTLRPNNYNYISSFWNVTFSSNDASQFYLANADSQTGSPAPPGTVTRTTLTSPSISLSGYTTANLNFWHYVRYTESDAFLVQVSTNNGASWTTVKSYITMQGSATSFANAIINLDAYVGLPDVKIRFDFTSYWAYGWAIDNVSVTGTLSTALTWSPITNLYTNSQATIPYVANMPLSVVYAKPNVTTTYTATSTAANGCFRNATATITVSPPSVGGTTSGNQSICSGTPSDIILTGYVGDVIRWEYADNAAFTSNVTAIAGTTATLSAAQMGVFPLTRYFRAVVKSGSCNEAYSSVVSITFPTTVWNGAAWSNGVPNSGVRALFEGNYNSSGNLTACSVLVNSGAVVFNANHNLTAVNEVTVAGGSMTFENNSSLVQVNNVANSGNIYYKRTTTPIKRFDYTYWSTPVHPQTLFNVSPDTPSGSCFRYDQLINYWVSVPSNTVMDPARGYIIRAPQSYDVQTAAPFNATFYGIPNNGTISIPIVVNVGNYNLIGNPYPSALDINAFLSYPSNISKVDATVYLWTHNTPIASYQYTSNDYAVYNYLGSTGTSSAPNLGVNNGIPNGKIASGQSFFIKGLSNGDVTFTNSMRISGNNNQFFRMENPPVTAQSDLEKHRFWLDVVSPQGAYKQILVGYAETATDAIDRGFDGEYMDVGNQVAIYSLCSGLKLNIQGRALPFSAADEVPVGFKGSVAGDYQIRLYDFDGLFSDQDVFLKDTFLNAVHNLKQSAYTFHSEAGVFDGRFVVVYHDTTLGNPDIMDDNTVVIYKPHDKLIIDSGNKIMKSVKVFDIRGRLIFEKKDINTTETALELGAVNQVYMIQITTDDLRIINKKYVN